MRLYNGCRSFIMASLIPHYPVDLNIVALVLCLIPEHIMGLWLWATHTSEFRQVKTLKHFQSEFTWLIINHTTSPPQLDLFQNNSLSLLFFVYYSGRQSGECSVKTKKKRISQELCPVLNTLRIPCVTLPLNWLPSRREHTNTKNKLSDKPIGHYHDADTLLWARLESVRL